MKKLMVLLFAVLVTGYAGAQTKTAIKPTDLMKEITDHIGRNYPDFKIDRAHKVEANQMVTYEVNVQKGATRNTLIYDDKGAFLRTEARQATNNEPVKYASKENGIKHTNTSAKPTGGKSAGKVTNHGRVINTSTEKAVNQGVHAQHK